MKPYTSNIAIGILGLIVMLVGLVFFRIEVIAIPLIGVGGSILATAIVNWVLTRRLEVIPIHSIIEALFQKTEFMRIRHEAELVFSIENGKLRLDKRHKYRLKNPSRFTRSRVISIYTDATGETGGFHLVIEPNGSQLDSNDLRKYVKHIDGKNIFSKSYDLNPGDSNPFEFRSFDYYRLTDRLIWTVQDLSDGFLVRVINKTGMATPFEIKINHHREKEIAERISSSKMPNEVTIEFDSEVLPYQGFEVMWKLDEN